MGSYVTVDSFLHPIDAHLAKGLLESEGIPVLLHSEHHVWSAWPLASALGGIRLQVPRGHLLTARALLDRQRSGEFQRALEEQQGIPEARCPRCGSENLRAERSPWSVLLLLATLGLSGVIFPPGIRARRCGGCGARVPAEP